MWAVWVVMVVWFHEYVNYLLFHSIEFCTLKLNRNDDDDADDDN